MTRVEIAEGQGYKVWWAPISVAAGTTQLVPRQPGKKISVANYALVATQAGTAKFADASGDLTGAMYFAAGGGICCPGGPSTPWFQTSTSEPLKITTTAPFEGHIAYSY